MSGDSLREFDRHMRREHGVVIDDATETFVKDLREKKLKDYADTIVSNVDKAVPKILIALVPPLMLFVLYFIMKTAILIHPLLFVCAVLGMPSAFFFAVKYDHASKICRYCGIGIAMAEEKNLELKGQNTALAKRVSELE